MTTETTSSPGTALTDASTTQSTADTGTPAPAATTNTEVKDDAHAQTDTKDEPGKGDGAKPDVPVEYDFKAPEGLELNADDVGTFKALAAELKLSPENAQKVVDIAIAREQARVEAFTNQVKEWGEQTAADKEFGGAKLAENLAVAKSAVEKFATPEFKSLLDSSGMGNHPEVVRLFVKIGKAISEDKTERGAPATDAKSAADVLYGSPNQ